jgi:hypothetical protein
MIKIHKAPLRETTGLWVSRMWPRVKFSPFETLSYSGRKSKATGGGIVPALAGRWREILPTRDRFARIPVERALAARLKGRQWDVLVAIAGHANQAGEAWPSLETIAAETGVGRTDLPRIIGALVRAGLIEREKEGARAKGRPSNLYRVVGLTVCTATDSAGSDSRATDSAATGLTVCTDTDLTDPGNRPIPHTHCVRRARARTTPIPADWKPSPEGIRYAIDHGIDDLENEIELYRDIRLSEGRQSANWEADFRTFVRRGEQMRDGRFLALAS